MIPAALSCETEDSDIAPCLFAACRPALSFIASIVSSFFDGTVIAINIIAAGWYSRDKRTTECEDDDDGEGEAEIGFVHGLVVEYCSVYVIVKIMIISLRKSGYL